ncbi:dynein intermediate chain, putative [Trypanosoma cruzi]|uniref:Dynein intermediate chain n=2 Tax=Trypanosoma cruzi TaxID=5693 RepID=V5DSN6_TRYCR|nr:dynein intermediate chain, putative [Trypanosoma cruzi]ESS70406.1 dynein intermediate chain [Trypanosoma cruzi Dm28c]KAF8287338.1 Dynein intermediate chain 1, axonemal [Trypanosoma cruzi]PWU93985.1 Dynein intermediate chain 1, axonemal [Trypanosoma cruzi]RNF24605.1 dynein intermediate-chain-like protein [Trypanosoma cruzi]
MDGNQTNARRASHNPNESHPNNSQTSAGLPDATGGQQPGENRDAVVERILKGTDPGVMSTPVYFDYKKDARAYRFFPSVGQTARHFSQDGSTVRKDDPEAVQQAEDRQRREHDTELAARAELNPDLVDEGVSTSILKNQFNYRDRGNQTMNNCLREQCVMTDPPPSTNFSAMATAWEIYDAYEEDRIQNEKAAAAHKKATAHRTGKDEEKITLPEDTGGSKTSEEILSSSEYRGALKIIERMVNQNDCHDIIEDFKYWEDESDLYKEDGNLLPLWQFFTTKVKHRAVTSISLNNRYKDLFAVGFGSYDFQRQGKGSIHCFTLKNTVPTLSGVQIPAHPEFSFNLESGVMCLAFHPEETALLACGLHDGSVCVFDLRILSKDGKESVKPICQSDVRSGKHMDPVWEIHWCTGTMNLQFYSISTDGRITSWSLHKKELVFKDVMTLTTGACASDPEAILLSRLGGTCFDFSVAYDGLFIAGTQEGSVMLCSKGYNGQCLVRYEGHTMPVYTCRWNPFHPDIFITCSADWTVKLWLKNSTKPLLTFDAADSVGDIAWAPYSSTVFAAVTSNGKVFVFDLNKNKREPLCSQTVVKNAKLTHVAFHKKEPVVLVGDSRGSVLILKLSPNLRILCKPKKGEPDDPKSLRKLEVEKLDRLIDITLRDRVLLGQL